MGAYLSEPIREKESVDESLYQLTYGASCMQGWRVSQEVAIFMFQIPRFEINTENIYRKKTLRDSFVVDGWHSCTL